MTEAERYFGQFRKNISGIDAEIETPFGLKKLVYADWIASGRLYTPIERKISEDIGVMVGNTHSEITATGNAMTSAYNLAHQVIKRHVNAGTEDVLLFTGSGMTSAIVMLQRLLGLKIPEQAKKYCGFSEGKQNSCKNSCDEKRPVVFITHTEHHSNHTSWLETIADVVVLEPSDDLTVNPEALRREILKYSNRPLLIGSFSACSNVTGYFPPYYELAEIMHEHGGYCFVDFAASAPYVNIDMHPRKKGHHLDAIFFSPHKFLGGPGSAGVLVFNKELYKNISPDKPGGGTLLWSNRWGGYSYINDIEIKEDGGTPGFLQAIKAALAVSLKEKMGAAMIRQREKELIEIAFRELKLIKGLHILAENIRERLGVFSFYVDGIHHNLLTKILNDRFGIQARGGCSCAGTYGHFLLNVDFNLSKEITDRIEAGDLSMKPGWIRLSLHPTMTNEELYFIIDALKQTVENCKYWSKEYKYDLHTNNFYHKDVDEKKAIDFASWFELQ
jgi:selenocysteine lyase/cysteine desulfurase